MVTDSGVGVLIVLSGTVGDGTGELVVACAFVETGTCDDIELIDEETDDVD